MRCSGSSLKRVFEKLRFYDGLVWTVGFNINAEIELRFEIPPAQCVRGLNTRDVLSVWPNIDNFFNAPD